MERERRKRVRDEGVPAGKDGPAEAVALDDGWVWGVIFATTALAALVVAALFTVAAG
jgi:hypothetical protein